MWIWIEWKSLWVSHIAVFLAVFAGNRYPIFILMIDWFHHRISSCSSGGGVACVMLVKNSKFLTPSCNFLSISTSRCFVNISSNYTAFPMGGISYSIVFPHAYADAKFSILIVHVSCWDWRGISWFGNCPYKVSMELILEVLIAIVSVET